MSKKVHKFDNFKWIDFENPTESDLKSTTFPFDVDEYFLEDVLELGHLPKIEKTSDYLFVILRAYTADDSEMVIEVKQISTKVAFFIYKNRLITIHRASLQFIKETPHHFKSPYELALYLFNELLITYDQPIQSQADKMDEFELNLFLKGGANLSIEKLYFEKSKARLTKKILLIMQSVLNQLEVNNHLSSTLQDTKDTALHLILRAEEVIEDSNSLLNSYMTFTAQKSNDVMKLLTVFSAFFLPLTFIVGVYGMNFAKMPELSSEYGYFITLFAMFIIAVLIYIWFKRKKIL